MLAKIFLELTEYSWFRRLVWKPIYQLLSSKFKNDNWHYMNYGYNPSATEPPLDLPENNLLHQYQVQLYHYLAIKTQIEDKDVLEVGSGRGGGARDIAQYLKPKSMTGMDLASKAVDLCNNTHTAPNLKYITGDAENIPLPDACMDVVINVESSHAYGSVDKFLTEVKRVLRPDGYLLLVDLRGVPGMELLKKQLSTSGLILREIEDITNNVVEAIELEDEMKWKRIKESIPKWLHSAFGEFGGAVGSQTHVQLKNRDLLYYRFKFQKEI